MLISTWLRSFRERLGRSTRRSRRSNGGREGHGSAGRIVPKSNEELESRVLLAAPTLVKIASTNTGRLISTDPASPDTLNVAPEQFTLTFNPGQMMDVSTAQGGAISAVRTDIPNAEPVNIGFVGAGASPEEIVVRFAETLPNGSYSLDISGGLSNTGGERFNDTDGNGFGTSQSVTFNLDLGAQIVAVVPQQVDISGTSPSQSASRNEIVVYFNDDDLNPALAEDPALYQLIDTRETEDPYDDRMVNPTSVVYDSVADTATLTFANDLDDLFAMNESLVYRLRIGTNEPLPTAPTGPRRIDISGSAETDFGFLQDVNSDGVDEFVSVTFRLADSPPGSSQEGKSVQLNFTSDAGAGSSAPLITADAVTGQIDVVLSANTANPTTLSDLLAGLSRDPDAAQLIRIDVLANSFPGAEIGTSLDPAGLSMTLFDPGSSFRTAGDGEGRVADLDVLGADSRVISAEIEPQMFPFDFAGSMDEPGQRELEIWQFVPSFDTRYHPGFIDEPVLVEDSFDRFPLDPVDPALVDGPGVETLFYNFQTFVGFDPEGLERTNTITENQKDRVREVFDFYGNYLGIQFVETANRGLTIARSDMRVLNGELFNGAGDENVGIADPARKLGILDASENWNDTFADYTDPANKGTVNFFEEAMEVVGLLLGLGNTDHVPDLNVQGVEDELTFVTTSTSNQVELDYPGDIDIVSGQHIHPPESKDIDLYRFEVAEAGLFSAEVFAERLTSEASLLDATLNLYRVTENPTTGAVTESELIASNDDYFSEDPFLEINLKKGVYFIGVSASGNNSYDPSVEDSGIGGRTQGKYELNIDFRPSLSLDAQFIAFDAPPTTGAYSVTFDGTTIGPISASATATDLRTALETHPELSPGDVEVNATANGFQVIFLNGSADGRGLISVDDTGLGGVTATIRTNVLADATGTLFDGDRDGVPGGVNNFWFRAVPESSTFFVNRTETIAAGNFNVLPDGERVYAEIDRALADAAPGTIVRIVGNTSDQAYEIGVDGGVLRDGRRLEVPQGVTVMIDAGAILKLRDARIAVGSFDQVTDRSQAALQVLGVPTNEVYFTSRLNQELGGNTTPTPTVAAAGDWGGIVFQDNVDRAAGRAVYGDMGIFLNHVTFGEFTHGGGRLRVGASEQTINPIHAISSRPTIINSTIVLSSDSAMSADPDSFEESRFAGYTRVGPEIYGNTLAESTDKIEAVNDGGNIFVVQNAANGLFIRVQTPAGTSQRELTVSARFDDRDITHILTENLKIKGTPGGRIDALDAPELDRGSPNRTTLVSTGVGDLPYGTYSYRMTFVDRNNTTGEILLESPPSDPSDGLFITGDGNTGSAIQLTSLPIATGQYNGRRLYRSHDGVIYTLVAELNASTTSFLDNQFASGIPLNTRSINHSAARPDASLVIDPGIIIKSEDAGIQVGIGAQLVAEGVAGREIIFTSRKDDSFGKGGTFDTNDDASVPNSPGPAPGDWGGIFIGHLSRASISDSLITYGGGSVTVPGGFATFNALEIHQAEARIVGTILENNEDGTGGPSPGHRFGRGANGSAVIFVRAAQPVLANNIIRNNDGAAISINTNALNHRFVADTGRVRGPIVRLAGELDNQGPLILGNAIDGNTINGMRVRGEVVTTEVVFDDTNIVHVLLDEEIVIPDVVTYGGVRLESSTDESLVVKLSGANAGFTALGRPLDIDDRIGGVLHVIGQPGKPVVLTSLHDDSVGAGFNLVGLPQNDTNGNGLDTNNDGMRDVFTDADNDAIDDITGQPIFIQAAAPGDWFSITIDQFAHDRNVGIWVENESPTGSAPGANGTADTAEVLGELAPLEDVVNGGDLAPLTGPANPIRGGGDDTLRLGFEVQGLLNEPNDVDVYGFFAVAGSEIWLDIDSSRHALDTVVDLISDTGKILASSDNTIDEQAGVYAIFEDGATAATGLKARSLNKSIFEGDDFFTTNQRDAGMRLVLPGSPGERGIYYVRVRSSNIDSLNPAADRNDLLSPAKLGNGRTAGNYQLQIRLREKDETPGSTVRYADIRFATDGIRVQGQPTHSPLQGDFMEVGDVSNTFGSAAQLGNLLNTEQGTLSVSAALQQENDIDFFRFDVTPDSVRDESIGNPGGPLVFEGGTPIIFDLDYADDNGGGNTRLAVFNSAGELILFADDSNVTDDRPAGGEPGGDADDKSRGSIGEQDPFIGPVELPAGTYFAAVYSKAQIPNSLSFLLEEAGANLDEVRVEPVNSIARIADERFLEFADEQLDVDQPTASEPRVDLFDEDTLFASRSARDPNQVNRVPWDLTDVVLYVSTDEGLTGNTDTLIRTVDAFSGVTETVVGPRVTGVQPVGDIAMRQDGELFGFATAAANGTTNDATTADYLLFNTGNGASTDRGGSDIQTFNIDGMGAAIRVNNNAGAGFQINGIAYYSTSDAGGVFVGSRNFDGDQTIEPMNENILFNFNVDSGRAADMAMDIDTMNAFHANFQAGTNRPALGFIDTTGDATTGPGGGLGGMVTGIAFPDSSTGFDTDGFAITDAGGLHAFDPFDTDFTAGNGSVESTFLGDIGAMIGIPGIEFQGLAAGPDDIEAVPGAFGSLEGRYEDIMFAISEDGILVAIDVSQVTFNFGAISGTVTPAPIFVDGASFIQVFDEDGFPLNNVTGLDFGTLTRNLWHVSSRDIDDTGHGAGTPFDFSRDFTDDGAEPGGSALFFGNEFSGSTAGNKNNRGMNNTINDVRNLDFPNGAHGSIISNPFDLSTFTAADKPSLEFNYYLQTEDRDAAWAADTPADNNPMTDSFRVFVGGDDGAWNLVATNNSLQQPETAQRIDEFDYAPVDPNDPLSLQEPISDGTGVFSTFPLGQDYPDVVELYDDPQHDPGGAGEPWRQAVIDLSSYAGRSNLRLRFDFSTAGGMDFADGLFHTIGASSNDVVDGDRHEEVRAVAATELQDGQRFELDGDGGFSDIDAFNAGQPATVTGDHFEFDFGYMVLAPSGNAIADENQLVVEGVIFEFEKHVPSVAVNPINITDLSSNGQVADAIARAVNAAGIVNGTGAPVTAVAAGNRVNFINATTLDTTQTPALTQAGDPEYGEPGVRAGHIAVNVNLGMDRAGVALAIKAAIAENYFSTPTVTVGGDLHHISETETPAPNNSLATAFDVDLGPWGLTFDTAVDNGLGISTTIPHLSIFGSGDNAFDYYSFTGTAGSQVQIDIDTTNGWDTWLRLFQDNGGSPIEIAFDDDTFPQDDGSTTTLDSLISITLPADDTYYVEVSEFPGSDPIAIGATYELQLSVENHPTYASFPGGPETEPNDTQGTAQDLDAQIWAPTADPTINDTFGTDISTLQPHTSVFGATSDGLSFDFYSFTVTDGDQVYIDVDKLAGQDIDMRVLDSGGGIVASTVGTSPDAGDNPSLSAGPHLEFTVNLGGPATDVFTIQIYDSAGGDFPVGAGTRYDLHVSVTSQPDGSALLAQIPDLGRFGTTVTQAADPTNVKGFHQQGFIELVGHNMTNNGPLGWSNTLPGDEFGAFGVSATTANGWNRTAGALRGVNNRIEGVWVDDIVIGVAERGQIVTNAPSNTGFRVDTRIYGPTFDVFGDVDRDHPNYSGSPDNLDQLTGPYTLEIRKAPEFAANAEDFPIKSFLFRDFDATARLNDSISLTAPAVRDLWDGLTFTLSDGIDELVFEFDDINVGNGITADVAIPIDPLLDGASALSSQVVASTIASIINSSTVQDVLDLTATAVGDIVDIFGTAQLQIAAETGQGLRGSIKRGVESTHQTAPLGAFDTFQFENTSTTENISVISVTLPDNHFFDIRDIFDPLFPPLFEGSDPGVSNFSDSVGATFFSDAALTTPLQDGDQTVFISFTDFNPGEHFEFNIGVSRWIDQDLLTSLFPNMATAEAGSDDLIGSTATAIFDSNASGAADLTDRTTSGRFFDSRLIVGNNANSEAVLSFSGIKAVIHEGYGDSNTERDQGQILIESNVISDSANFGIVSGPGESNLANHRLGNFATGLGVLPGQGAVRNAIELNDLGLVPGIVIENNILIRGGTGGIDFAGDPNSVAPFGRIINNTILGGAVSTAPPTPTPVTFDGIVFPNGLSSFADVVTAYDPLAGGGSAHPRNNPLEALGVPDDNGNIQNTVGLGDGGVLILEFTDNILIPSGDSTPDLHVFERGINIEIMIIDVSEDGLNWINVGTISGQPSSIDIDGAPGIDPAGLYRFVRITDDINDQPGGIFPGAEIDAVGAISSLPVTFVGTGIGIQVRDNASPTIVNNALASLDTALQIDASSSAAGTVSGANFYVDNVNDLGGIAVYGTFDTSDKFANNPDWTLRDVFVDVGANNLYPTAGSPLIDSSLDSLPDRPEIVTIRDPLGLAQSPVLAPDLDAFGQTRGDDDSPGTGPGAPGANVRKDRGAIDRVDFDDPNGTVLVVDSRLNGNVEVVDQQERFDSSGNPIPSETDGDLANADRLSVGLQGVVREIILRFSDIGVGIDDAPILAAVNDTTGNVSLPFTLYQDGVELIEGTDYIFVWNSNKDEAIFRHVTQFPIEHAYTIVVDNDPANGSRPEISPANDPNGTGDGVVGVRDLAGNFIEINQPDGSTQYHLLITDGENDPPIINVPQAPQSVNEDMTLQFSVSNGNPISISDADVHLSLNPTLNVVLSTTVGTLTLADTTGLNILNGGTGTAEPIISFSGHPDAINAALDGLIFAPPQDYFNLLDGQDPAMRSFPPVQFTIMANDDDGTGNGQFSAPPDGPGFDTVVLPIDVISVNDEPSFNPPGDPAPVDEDTAGVQSVPGFVTGMLAGPANESSQTLAFLTTGVNVTAGNVAFLQPPTISAAGDLTFELAPNTNGTVEFTFVLQDFDSTDPNHVTANSQPHTSTLIVNPINDEPSFTLTDTTFTSNEDDGVVGPIDLIATVAVGPVDATDETTIPATMQTPTFEATQPVVTNGNLLFSSFSLNPVTGELTFEAAPDTAGTVKFDVRVVDDGPTNAHPDDDNASDSQTVTLVITAQPDPPVPVTGDYVIDDGDDLDVDASLTTDADLAFAGTVTEQLMYSWDIGSDGTFEVVDSLSPLATIPYATLAGLGLTIPGDNPLTLRVTDTFSGTSVDATATLTIHIVDYGHAPDINYRSLKANNGAAHTIVPGMFLGTGIDDETDGIADDAGEDDGIVFDAAMQADGTFALESFFTATASTGGKLDIWIDYDNNLQFDAGEHLNGGTSFDLMPGVNNFTFTIPAGVAVTGVDTWARARFSSAGGAGPTGRVDDGEVEDYSLQISPLLSAEPVDHILPMWSQTSDLTPLLQWIPNPNTPGANVTYNIELQNELGQVVGFEENHTTTSISLSDPLPPGSYTAFVTSFNRAGQAGPTSQLNTFEVVALAVTSPAGGIDNGLPTIEWTPVDRTDHYELEIQSSLTGATIMHVPNIAGTLSSYTVPSELPIGGYRVRVRAHEDTTLQVGDWSAFQLFDVRTAPTVTAPLGTIGDGSPQVTWTGVPGAATYDVRITDITEDVTSRVALTGITGTSASINQVLGLGEYTVEVRALTTNNFASAWSGPDTFFVSIPTNISQPSGREPDSTPTIVWSAVTGADNYDVEIVDSTINQVAYTANGVTGTQHTIPAADALPLGNYEVRIRANNVPAASSSGATVSVLSGPSFFTVSTAPRLLSPAVGIYDTTPEFTWTEPAGAQTTQLEVYDIASDTLRYENLGIAGTSFDLPASDALAPDGYYARIRSVGAGGVLSDWSTPLVFTIGAAPVALGPSEGLGAAPHTKTHASRPTLTAQQSLSGVTHEFWLTDVSNNQTLHVVQGLESTSWTVPEALAVGAYRYWVRAKTDIGELSAWSRAFFFEVVTPPVVADIGSTFNLRPTIEWDARAEIDTSRLWLNKVDVIPAEIILVQPGIAGNSFELPFDLAPGKYKVWLEGYATGVSPNSPTTRTSWSVGTVFETNGRPKSVPLGNISDDTPLLEWDAVTGASHYEVYFAQEATFGTAIVRQSNITGTSFEITTPQAPGNYIWWVRAFDSNGKNSPWSLTSRGRFSIQAVTTPVVNAIADSNTTNPLFSWTAVTGAARYRVYVAPASDTNNPAINEVTTNNATQWVSATSLTPGDWRVWVQAISATGGNGPWSVPVLFTILAENEVQQPDFQPQIMLATMSGPLTEVLPESVSMTAVAAENSADAVRPADEVRTEDRRQRIPVAETTADATPSTGEDTAADVESDSVMESWDTVIWAEESGDSEPAAEQAVLTPAEDQPESKGWLAGLAMLAPSFLRRRRNKRE